MCVKTVFFFQATDGIRDDLVTGVQTCALPICLGRADGPAATMKPGAAAASAAVLDETARRAAGMAGLDLPAERAVIGAAGAGRPQEQAELAAALGRTGSARPGRGVTDGAASLG